MPYYEFKCRSCSHVFTEKQSFDEHDRRKPIKCPKCNDRNVEQQIPVVNVATSKKS